MVRAVAKNLLFFLTLVFSVALTTSAQVTTADIVGRVTDSTGAVIYGARITIENLGTRNSRTTLTGTSGDYVLSLLPPGRYTLRIEAAGFKTFVLPDLTLAAGDRGRGDAQMQIGQMQETVEVLARTPALQSDSSTLSTVVTERPVQDLPLNGRNYIELAQLVAGGNAGPPGALSSGTRPDDRRQTSSVSVNGQSDVLNNNLIDGIDNNERVIGTIGVRPSIDAIAEFRVQTSLYSAEVGRTPGAVVNIVTKSGTNSFHGSLYEFLRNDKLDARNFFSTAGPKPKYRQNQFGGSIGGPIRKNRTFFFGDYEGLRVVQGVTGVATVPTPAQTRGDFSDLSSPIIDPFTQTQFPGNVIPPERIDSIGAHYAALYPAPTAAGLVNNYSGSQDRTQFSHTFDARVDHRFSDDDSFFARYSFNDVATFTPGIFPATDGIQPGGNLFAWAGRAEQAALNAQLNFIHIFSPRLLMELKAGFARLNNASFPLNYGINASERFGLNGVNVSPQTSGLTPSWLTGYSSLGDSTALPLQNVENNFQYAGSLTYTRGTHNLKIGAALIRRQALNAQQMCGIGVFVFTGLLTGNSLADLLLGISTQTTRQNELVAPGYRMWEPGIYIQDDWRARTWFTFSLGVRYDVFTPFTEAHNRISNLDTVNARILVAGENGVSKTAGIKTDYRDVAPRVGFAATLAQGMVVRGGYGLTFFPTNYTAAFNLKNAPFASSYGPVYFQPLSAGLPPPSPINPNNPSGTLSAQALDYRPGYLQQFNLTVEKELNGNVLRVGYIGQLGRHLAQILPNINIAPPSPLPNPRSRSPFATRLPNAGNITFAQSAGTSSYNALQISFERRYKAGLTMNSNYTWSHGIDDVCNLSGYPYGYGVLPSAVAEVDRGNADLDARHRFVLTANYEIPLGKSLKGSRRMLLQGWQINGIAAYQTGLPFTILNASPLSNTGVDWSQLDRPNRIKSGTLGHPTLDEYFDTSAFVPQTFGTLGNSGRNILFAPSFKKVDLSLFKQFDLKEPWRLQFRAECYNITNTPSFATPNALLGDPGFGTISTTHQNYTPRQFQFALKLLF
jgi:hypothetical protein